MSAPIPANVIEGFQLSPHQRRLWLTQQIGNARSYHAQFALLLEGEIDPAALNYALRRIVERHDILRTAFRSLPGAGFPLQVADNRPPCLDEIDLRDKSAPAQTAEIDAMLAAHARNLDFERGGLLRTSLLALAAQRHVLLISVPALCADAATLRSFTTELASLYQARRTGADYDEDVVQYAQYAEWRNDAETDDTDARAGKEFWSKHALPAVTLPFESTGQGALACFAATIGMPQDIEAFADARQTSAETVLFACWQTLLSRLTGAQEIVVHKNFDGRPYEELKNALGLYAQLLPVPCSFAQDRPFSAIARDLDAAVRVAAEHEAYFSPPNTAEPAIGFEYYECQPRLTAGDVSFSILKQNVCLDYCKLKLACTVNKEDIALDIEYDSARFNGEDVARIARYFSTLLVNALRHPDSPVSALNILSEDDRRRLVVDWNATHAELPIRPIHELFEQQAARTPDNVALVCSDRTLRYAELNDKANQLAHHLRKLGAGKDTLVGLCTDRTSAMLIGFLGILKAGAAYVPLNSEYPKTRLAQQLEQVQASIVVTQEKLLDGLPVFDGEVLCLDRDWKLLENELTSNPETPVSTDDLAYVIFTSGSTGVPKGVAVTHANLANYTGFICDKLQLTESALLHFATVTTLSADLGNTSIFPCLFSGGCLHVIDYEAVMDAGKFATYVERHPIDVLKIVPSHFNALLAAGPGIVPKKVLIFGGEALSWALVQRVRDTGAQCRIINHYGPTETTVGCLTFDVERESRSSASATVPIGRPIANAQAYVLDRHMQPAPVGIAGELYIGGHGVARGYFDQPAQTAEHFLADPYALDSKARLYKTGDRARYLAGGDIEFLGRADDQVKIHGFRIELGEIEAALASHPAVRQAAVIAREDIPGEKRLVAYLAGDALPATADLRVFLREQLPAYMMPGAFVALAALPLTRNGKIDRKALPLPDSQARHRVVIAPRNAIEQAIAEIWIELLKVEPIGIRDDFFELGGHSLLIIQVMSRVRQMFEIDLPLKTLFEAPTVESMSLRIAELHAASGARGGHVPRSDSSGARSAAVAAEAIPLLPRSGGAQSFPLSLAQQRLWFLHQFEHDRTGYNMSQAIRLRGALDVTALVLSINDVIARHESLRTAFIVNGDEVGQVVEPSVALPVPVADLGGLPAYEHEAEIRRLAADEARLVFDLSRAPLMRARLARMSDHEHVLFLTIHHIVSDGLSRGVLNRELAELYRAHRAGRQPALPELGVQYADFAVWQRRWLEGGALNRQLEYWKRQLGGVLPALELPLDYPRPRMQNHDGGRRSLVLPASLADALRSFSRRDGATVFMTLLAAFQLLLARLSGQEDILIGTPIAGRNRVETEALVGFFIGTLVMRGDLSGNPSFRELLRRTRETAVDAYANQDVPFEKLVEELQPERNTARNPIFGVLINYFSKAQVDVPQFDGLTAEVLRSRERPSKFEMTLYIRDDGARLALDLAYQTALFSAARMACVLNQYQYLLEQICAAPEQAVKNYSLVAPGSQASLPDPSAPIDEAAYRSTTGAIRDWTRKAPDKTAVVDQAGRHYSYAHLWSAASAVAQRLRAAGLQRKDVVAIAGEKSLGLIAAMIGTLLSGGVMLAVDRKFPAERHLRLLREAGAKHLLYVGARRREDEWIDKLESMVITYVDADPGAESIGFDIEMPAISGDDPAYIFFTSGTTGIPKAVLGCHKGLNHFLTWQRETFAIGPEDRVGQLTALSFDVLLRDIFLPLTSGASLHLPDENEGLVPDYILPWLARERISVLHTVPALAQSWVSGDLPAGVSLSNLRWTFFAGEPLNDVLVQQWRDVLGVKGGIVNLYGPTETTMAKGFHRVEGDGAPGVQPVGRPIPQTQLLVLNANAGLCGIGEPGEIAIRTPFRTLGYINSPDENRQRFVRNPFREDEHDLLYMTGDRGRYRLDGALSIEGRLDDQVKINGVRVEPGEAAAMLAGHPAVQACFVLASKNEDGNSLAAYVVLKKGQSASASDLRSFLSARAPAPLIPSGFVFLDRLPLLPNGKIDRKALPTSDDSGTELEAPYVAPRTPAEQSLADIWAEVLKADRVGVHDNFFELGGHSLLATRVVARVRHSLRCELPLGALFEAPTIEGLAVKITDIQMQDEDADEMARFLAELESSDAPRASIVHARQDPIKAD